jgi:anaerobic dimethyl sulfoxide reductase subunit B (iron-sulfur subunit)
MTQHGFFFDQSRCIGCNACLIACEQWHDISPGSVKWMRVYQWERGTFPNVKIHILAIPCYHCENPVCVKVCPNRALYKEKKYGAVLVDKDQCQGTRKCWSVCPYGVPQYEGDELGLKMSKFTMCIDRLQQGLKPICVLSCSMRALEFGPLDELKEKYGNLGRIQGMPKDSITRPAVVFKPADPKKRIVYWDSERVLELWQKRESHKGEPLPDVFSKKSDVSEASQHIIGRNKLVLKAKKSAIQKYYTTDDE